MLPDNTLSPKAFVDGFSFPVKQPGDFLVDWELAGVALNDPSEGLMVKLWKLTVEPNTDTGFQDVAVSAPGVAPIVLFSGNGITEAALSFDQNMNPFVAYLQSGVPKIYWFDPTIPGMTHTTLPAGCYDLRCTLDDKRQFNVGESDIVLGYIRAGNLCVRYQRERYAVENILRAGVGADARLVSMAMNVGWRLQFRLRNHTLTAEDGALIQVAPYLADIVQDLCSKSCIARENIGVSDLWRETDIVPGMKVEIETGLDKPIEWLAEMYLFDKSQHGRKLRFEHRGKPVTFRIPYSDLVTNGNKEVLQQERVDGKSLPKMVTVTHIDPDAGFAKNKQTATRRSNLLTTDDTVKIESQVVLAADQAATAALTVLKARWGEQYTYKFSTTLKYAQVTASDVGEVQASNGDWLRIRMTEKNEDEGIIDWEAKMDAGPTVYGETSSSGNALPPPISTTPGLVGDTVIEILNLSPQRDQEDELCLYVAARGASSGWSGYALLVSYDGGTSYSEALRSKVPSNIGETATSISASGTSVEVIVPYPLSSVTPEAILSGQNRAVIGLEEIQYQTASLIGSSGGMLHYNITGISRKVLGTVAAVWPAGTRFVHLDQSVIYAQVQRSYYDKDIKIKAVSIGQSADEVAAITFHTKPMLSQTEWPVTDVAVTPAAGGGVTVSWTGSPRLGAFGGSPHHSKYMIGYRVKFSDGHTIDTTNETVTYAAGLMGTVVEVRALNEITGEGPLADGSGEVDPGDIPNFLFSGSFPDGYVGVPYWLWNGDSGVMASGGTWDANARGFVAPGVGVRSDTENTLDQFKAVGIPHQSGTFTTDVYLDASTPDPAKSGSVVVAQSITIHPRPTYAMLDVRFRQHDLSAVVMDTPAAFTKYQVTGACSLFFYGVTSGKVCAQFKIVGSSFPVLIGVSNSKGELTGGDYTVSIGPFGPATYSGNDGTYSVELDAGTGNYWIYKGGDGLKQSGNIPLDPGKQYRICVTSEYIQSFTLEANAGNEPWYMAVTQSGHSGIPMPVLPIPLAWGSSSPGQAFSIAGNGWQGALAADNIGITPHVAKSNAAYSSGKHRWKVSGGQSVGICVDSFDHTSGLLGSAGAPDSVGWEIYSGTLSWSLGGSSGSRVVKMPAPGVYPWPIWALDADNDTVKLCGQLANGDVVVLDTINIPSSSWRAAECNATGAARIEWEVPGPSGYNNAVV